MFKEYAGHLVQCLGVSHIETTELVIVELAHNVPGIRLDDVRQWENLSEGGTAFYTLSKRAAQTPPLKKPPTTPSIVARDPARSITRGRRAWHQWTRAGGLKSGQNRLSFPVLPRCIGR